MEKSNEGHAKISILFSNMDAHLRFMYVKPDFRGQGVNAAILDWLKNWALTRGVHELFLEVYEENIRARKAYEKAGFRPLMLEMRLSV